MGLLKLYLNLNNDVGTREAMRLSYKKIAKTLIRSVSYDIFVDAMYNAMATRYMVNNTKYDMTTIIIELKPFLDFNDQENSLSNLCEYVVYKEMPLKCNYEGLKREINKYLNSLEEKEKSLILNQARIFNIRWLELI